MPSPHPHTVSSTTVTAALRTKPSSGLRLGLSWPYPAPGHTPQLAASEHSRTPGRQDPPGECLPPNRSLRSLVKARLNHTGGSDHSGGSGSYQAQLGRELWGAPAPLAAPQETTHVQPPDTCSLDTLPGAGLGAWSRVDAGRRPQARMASWVAALE